MSDQSKTPTAAGGGVEPKEPLSDVNAKPFTVIVAHSEQTSKDNDGTSALKHAIATPCLARGSRSLSKN